MSRKRNDDMWDVGYYDDPEEMDEEKPKKSSKRGGVSRLVLGICVIGFLAALAYSAFVVMRYNEIQRTNDVLEAENGRLTGGEGAEAAPVVITVWSVNTEVAFDGMTMSARVVANVFNDSARVITNEDIPDLVCGGQHYEGAIDGWDSIGVNHGSGNIIWQVDGISPETQDYSLALDETHLAYYVEKIPQSILASRLDVIGY